MNDRTRKLEKFIALAAAEEQRHGAATAESRRRLEECRTRLGELNAHRHNYSGRVTKMVNVSAAHWKDYRTFMQRLDKAVIAQQQIIRDAEQNLDVHRRRWQAKRQRLESLQKVLDRYRDEERQHTERLLQRVQDDLPAAALPYGKESER